MPINIPSGSPYIDSVRTSIDAFIVRFNSADNAQWSTYYGGLYSDYAKGIVIDHNNAIYVCGQTNSYNFPLYHYTGYYDTTLIYADAFMLKFNVGCQRYWASLFGGDNNDAFTGVAVDSLNNPYFFGWSASHNNYTNYQTPTVYYQSATGDDPFANSFGDGIVFMLNSTMDPKWCTYFGGNKADQIYGGSISAIYPQKLVVAGAALSNSNFPWQGTNAIHTYAGNEDAWVGRFDLSTSAPILSVQDIPHSIAAGFSIYPNPGDGHFTIQLDANGEHPKSLMIFDVLGQLVYSDDHISTNGEGQLSLNLDALDNGIYFVNLLYNDTAESKKFSIIR